MLHQCASDVLESVADKVNVHTSSYNINQVLEYFLLDDEILKT